MRESPPDRKDSLSERLRVAMMARPTGISSKCVDPCVADMLRVVGERMDEIVIVEPAATWEDAYKSLRREVGQRG